MKWLNTILKWSTKCISPTGQALWQSSARPSPHRFALGFSSVVAFSLRRIRLVSMSVRLHFLSVLCVCGPSSFLQAINYFSPSIFEAIGFSGTSVGLLATGVYGLVKTFFATFSFVVLVDRFGRRPLLLIGSAGCILSLYYLAGFSSITHSFSGSTTGGPASRAAIAMIYIYVSPYTWCNVPEADHSPGRLLCHFMEPLVDRMRRDIPNAGTVFLSCAHYLLAMAGSVHRRLFHTIYD